jgi:hypothetical protein
MRDDRCFNKELTLVVGFALKKSKQCVMWQHHRDILLEATSSQKVCEKQRM